MIATSELFSCLEGAARCLCKKKKKSHYMLLLYCEFITTRTLHSCYITLNIKPRRVFVAVVLRMFYSLVSVQQTVSAPTKHVNCLFSTLTIVPFYTKGPPPHTVENNNIMLPQYVNLDGMPTFWRHVFKRPAIIISSQITRQEFHFSL